MAKIPFRKVEHKDEPTSKLQDNVEEAINRLGAQTLDDGIDGKTYRKLLGVDYAHQLTNSGIATSTITAEKILTVSGTSLIAATVPVSALAPCNQFAVYRDAAFTMPAGAYSCLFANKTLKDVGAGWNSSQGVYTLPANGDWQFQWSASVASCSATGRQFYSSLLVNSGEVLGSISWSSAASQSFASVGSYLYANGRTGDRVKVQFWNGDASPQSMPTTSGTNFFQGYQLR